MQHPFTPRPEPSTPTRASAVKSCLEDEANPEHRVPQITKYNVNHTESSLEAPDPLNCKYNTTSSHIEPYKSQP